MGSGAEAFLTLCLSFPVCILSSGLKQLLQSHLCRLARPDGFQHQPGNLCACCPPPPPPATRDVLDGQEVSWLAGYPGS